MSEKHPEIGKHGEYEPIQCAITGQWVQGRHATTYHLGDGYYFRILNKVVKNPSVIKATRERLLKVIPAAKVAKTESKTS